MVNPQPVYIHHLEDTVHLCRLSVDVSIRAAPTSSTRTNELVIR